MGEDRNSQNENMSSAEYWKQLSQKLSYKKSEETTRTSMDLFDFESMKNTMKEITQQRIEGYRERITQLREESSTKEDGSQIDDICEAQLYEGRPITSAEGIFIHNELENSHTNKPIFSKLKTETHFKKIKVPDFFPKISPHMFSDPSFYKKFDLDTLFFIFYFFKGTIQQTYAAIRLKSFAWRFHLRYRIWFQRLDEPRLITVEYEKGEFLFFDYESTWNFMKKNDFVFEYCYLEHNDHY